MRNVSYKTASVFETTGGVLCPRCEEYGFSDVGNDRTAALDSVSEVRTFLWDEILPSMAKKMEVQLGYVREYVLSLSDANVSSNRLTPAEERVVDDVLRFCARIIRHGNRVTKYGTPKKLRKMAYVYVNHNTLRSLVWVHHVRSFERNRSGL